MTCDICGVEIRRSAPNAVWYEIRVDRCILLACQVCWADHRDAVLRDWRNTVRKRGKGE